MSIEFTSHGFIELWRGDVLVSRHRAEREALESASRAGPGEYVLRFPEVSVRVIGSVADPGTADTQAPTIPQGLSATAVNRTTIDLSWSASTDNVGVSGYQVFRDGAPLTTVSHPTTSHSDSTCDANTTYQYTVAAFDASGNTSDQSSPDSATTPANSVPSWSAIADQELIVGDAFLLDLDDYISDVDLDAIEYSLVSGSLPTGLSFNASTGEISGTPTTSGQSATLTFRADDGFDTADVAFDVDTFDADETAPPTPTGLAVDSVTANTVTLSWNASVDAAGSANEYVSGTQDYRVRRDGGVVATVSIPTYTDLGLSEDTTYEYTVTARDAELNESAESAVVEGVPSQSSGETVTTLTLTSPNTGTAQFQVGHGFAKGDVPSGSDVVSDTSGVTLRCVPKRYWNDGSLKHGILVGTASLTADTPKSITLKTGTAAGGTALTAADIASEAPTASVQCGSIGTVSLGDLLGSPFRTWISTPEMVECHYRGQVGSDDDLVAWFYVRMWADGTTHVRVAVENGYMTGSPTERTYTATVVIGGSTVHNASVTQYEFTRWDVAGWIGTDPEVTPAHNVTYLIGTKLVPNYWKRSPSSTVLNGLEQTYAPMQLDPHPTAGATTGFHDHIGPLPLWDALYCTTADERAYAAVITASRALGTYSVCQRASATNVFAKPSDFPTYEIDGGTFGASNTAGTIEFNHLQNTGFLAYLVTGEFFHYETMAMLASTVHHSLSTDFVGEGTAKLWLAETRGTGEMLRLMGHLCAIAPLEGGTTANDDDFIDEFSATFETNADHWKAQTEVAGQNLLGTLYQYNLGAWEQTGDVAPWMTNYWVGAMGQVSNMEPLADMTNFNVARDWMYKWPVGLAGSLGNWCFTHGGSEYGVKVCDNNGTTLPSGIGKDTTEFYDTWDEVWTETFGSENSSCDIGAALHNGDYNPAGAASNHGWGAFVQAMAYAVEHEATGASVAWSRITGASNFADLEDSGFDDVPIWGIVPRNWSALPYELPAAGEALKIASTNSVLDVKPASHSDEQALYSLFGSYGSGAMVTGYGTRGAYVLAGTGGHAHPPIVGAVLFDYADKTWKYVANGNGVAERASDYTEAETNGDPYFEITGTVVPSPPHPYANAVEIDGDFAYITRAAVCTSATSLATASHRMNLSTGVWSRVTTNQPPIVPGSNTTVLYDSVTERYFLLPNAFHSFNTLHYITKGTWAWGTLGSFGSPSDFGSNYSAYVLDPVRRLILIFRGTGMRVFDLEAPNSGWQTPTVSGLPDVSGAADSVPWVYHAGTGKFYWLPDSGGNTLYRLTAPGSSFPTGTWTVDTISLGGDTVPAFNDGAHPTQTSRYRSMHYNPLIGSDGMLVWVSGKSSEVSAQTQITLINPE